MGTKRDRQLVTDIASELMGKYPIDTTSPHPQYILRSHGDRVLAKVRRLRPETLGRIASIGLGHGVGRRDLGQEGTSMYAVHCESWIDKYANGLYILHFVAMTAIIARMWDLHTQSAPAPAASSAVHSSPPSRPKY